VATWPSQARDITPRILSGAKGAWGIGHVRHYGAQAGQA
jgi:hypothetical protein